MTTTKNTTFVITTTDPKTNKLKYLRHNPSPRYKILYQTKHDDTTDIRIARDKNPNHYISFAHLKAATHFNSHEQAKNFWKQCQEKYHFNQNNVQIQSITTEITETTETFETL